jgi:hypothetical protein
MLSLRTVAITDGATSLHSPLFVVGVTTTVVVADDEHDVATMGSAAAATKHRTKNPDRTGAHTTHAVGDLEPVP